MNPVHILTPTLLNIYFIIRLFNVNFLYIYIAVVISFLFCVVTVSTVYCSVTCSQLCILIHAGANLGLGRLGSCLGQ